MEGEAVLPNHIAAHRGQVDTFDPVRLKPFQTPVEIVVRQYLREGLGGREAVVATVLPSDKVAKIVAGEPAARKSAAWACVDPLPYERIPAASGLAEGVLRRLDRFLSTPGLALFFSSVEADERHHHRLMSYLLGWSEYVTQRQEMAAERRASSSGRDPIARLDPIERSWSYTGISYRCSVGFDRTVHILSAFNPPAAENTAVPLVESRTTRFFELARALRKCEQIPPAAKQPVDHVVEAVLHQLHEVYRFERTHLDPVNVVAAGHRVGSARALAALSSLPPIVLRDIKRLQPPRSGDPR